jgi:2'-5' RNA ligase
MSSPQANEAGGWKAVERLFFALWPSDEVRQAIRRSCKFPLHHCGGRPVAQENWHITLAFLGSVDEERRVCVEQMASAIQLPDLRLQLDQIGHWARPRVLWLGAHETPDELTELAKRLITGSKDCGLSLDKRPFKAHLTLKRKVKEPPPPCEVKPVAWPVDSFALVRSNTLPEGVQYEVVREWPLSAEF